MNQKDYNKLEEFQNTLQRKVFKLYQVYRGLFNELNRELSRFLLDPDGNEIKRPLEMLGIHKSCPKNDPPRHCTCYKQLFSTVGNADEEFSLIKPYVVFFGQSNAGKSTLINELLGKHTLAQFGEKCTARLVYISYSQKPFWFLEDDHNSDDFQVVYLDPETCSIPEEVQGRCINQEDRLDSKFIERSIVSAFPYPILQCCSFIDTPGMKENKILFAECQEVFFNCVKPLLVVYVLDASESLTETCINNCEMIQRKVKETQNRDIQILFFATRLDVDPLIVRLKEKKFMNKHKKASGSDFLQFHLNLLSQSRESKLSDLFYKLCWRELVPPREKFDDCEFTFGASLSILQDNRRELKPEIQPQIDESMQKILIQREALIHTERMDRFKSSLLREVQIRMTEGFMILSKLLLSKIKRFLLNQKEFNSVTYKGMTFAKFVSEVESLRENLRKYPDSCAF